MKHHTNKHLRRALALFMTVLMAMSCVSAGLSALAAIDGIPTRDNKDSFFSDTTLYGAEKWDQTSDVASLTFNWSAYSGSIGYDPQPGTLKFTYPSHIYLNVGETLEAAGYMGHMTASYGENDGSDVTDFRVMLSSATWGESTRAGFSPISSLISGYSHQGTVTEGSKLMSGSSSHYDFSNDGRGSDQIIGDKSGDNENFLAANESVVVWRSNVQWTGSDMNNFDEYVLLTGTANKAGEVTFNPTTEQNFTIGAAQRYTAFAWHSDNGTRFNRYAMNGGSRPQTTPTENALSMTFTVYDKSELARLIAAADNGTLTVDATALANAKAVLADREVTQTQIDAAAAAIGDQMTLLVNANINDYDAEAAVSTAGSVFGEKVYHFADEATEGYNSVVYAPAASTVEGEATNYMQFKRDNCYYRLFTPTNTVLVYYSDAEENQPKSPIMMGFVGDGSNNNRAVYYFANAAENTKLPLENYWVGYKDGSSNNRDYLTDTDKLWANRGSNSVYINGTVVNSGFAMTDNQGNKRTWRYFWNFFKYTGQGDTTNYYEKFDKSTVNMELRHHWNKEGLFGSDDDDTYNYGNTNGELYLPGTVYVLNYKPIYDALADTSATSASAIKAIIEGPDAWMYTEASIKRAKATIAAMLKANPNNYAYEGNVNSKVVACADAIKDAKYMLDHDGLTLVKKQGTVTFVSQTGETLAINGQPATYTKEYGETIVANEIPQLSNVYYRTDNAQWDYGTELSWSPALPATITVDEPEKIFQISDEQTVQTYTVNFYDEDGTTVLATADWQYGDYPVWGSDEAPTKQDYDYNYEVTGWKDGDNNSFTGLNAALNQFVAEGANYNSTAYLNGDKFTKYVAVYTKTAREDADYTAYNAALAAAQAVLNIPGLKSETATAIQNTIDTEIARAHDTTVTPSRNFRSDDETGVAAIATAVANLNAIVADYTDGNGNLKDDYIAEYTITWVNAGEPETTSVKYNDVPTHDLPDDDSFAIYNYTFAWDTTPVAAIADTTYTAVKSATKTTAANEAVAAAEAIIGNAENYDADYIADLTAAKDAVKNCPDTADEPTQANLLAALTDPATGLISKAGDNVMRPVDTMALASKIAEKQALLDAEDADKYFTADSISALTTAIETAQAVLDAYQGKSFKASEIDAKQGIVNAATSTLDAVNLETRNYTVTWNVDGTETQTEYTYNATPSFSGSTAKESDTLYVYTFSGWNPAIVNVTADATYIAQYTKAYNTDVQETIADAETIVGNADNFDDTYIEAIQTNLTVLDDSKEPVASDEEKEAALNNLKVLISEASQAANVAYLITFVNGATNETIKSEKVRTGEMPSCDLPTKDDDDLYTYSYAWDKDIVASTEATTYTAVETKNYKQSVLDTIQQAEDIITDANDDTTGDDYDPTYIVTIQEKLDILDDTKEPVATEDEKKAAVDALDELLDAQNDNKMYTITFVTEGSAVEAITKKANTQVNLPASEKDGYTFDGWYTESTFENKVTSPYTLTADITLHAKFNELSLEDAAIDEAIARATESVTMGICYTAETLAAYNAAKAAVEAYKGKPATAENLAAYQAALHTLNDAVAGLVEEHAYTGQPAITRPVKDAETGNWSKGVKTWTCANNADHPVKTEEVDRADYATYDSVLEQINDLLDEDLTDDVKTALETAKTALEAIPQDYIVDEQTTLDNAIQAILDTLKGNDKIDVDENNNITVDPDTAYKTYKLTLTNNVNTDYMEFTQKAGTQAHLNPTLAGYTLKGFSDNANYNAETRIYTFPQADDTITALFVKDLTDNETIENAQQIIADETNPDSGKDYDDDYIDDLNDLLDEINAIKDDPAKLDELNEKLEDLQALVDKAEQNRMYTITWVIDGESATTKVKYGDTPTHEDPTKEGYRFTGWEPAIAAVTADATYTAVFTEVSAQPAYYAEYDTVFEKLGTVPTNDKVTAELKAEAQDKLDYPLSRDLTADQQQIIDDEVAAIRAILDKIFEKDSNGNYTDDVKDGAAVKYTVVFHWLGATLTRTVVSGKGAKGPDLTRLYGVEGMEGGHFVFNQWVKDSEDSGIPADITNVTENMDVYAEYKQEAHTGAWIEHEATCSRVAYKEIDCTLCGLHFEVNTGSEKAPHDWKEVRVEPTCAHPGRITRTCKNDPSHTEYEVLAQLAHTDANGDTICDVCGNPTENHQHTDVNGDGKCDTCGAPTDAHVHNYQNGVCTGCGQTQDGSFRCNLCSVYEQYRHIPVAGWFLTAFHFFYHLICQITSWR